MSATRAVRVVALAIVLSLPACDSGTAFEEGGTLEGSVTVASSSEVGTDPHVMLYTSTSDLSASRGGARVPLNRVGSSFDFRVTSMTPGTYYLEACFSFGCEPYELSDKGPQPVVVRIGETTTVAFQI